MVNQKKLFITESGTNAKHLNMETDDSESQSKILFRFCKFIRYYIKNKLQTIIYIIEIMASFFAIQDEIYVFFWRKIL